MNLMFKISYGLYVLVAREGDRHNGCIINTLMQQSSNPETISFTVNKQNYTHDMIKKTEIASCCILSEDVKFDLIKNFGMKSGKEGDKFDGINTISSENGCLIPTEGVLGYFDFKVLKTIDMYTHTLFLCEATDKKPLVESAEALTYDYYHKNIKPRPQKIVTDEEAYICVICGYIHKGPIPDDIICPICKHGREAFVPVKDYNPNAQKKDSESQTAGEEKEKYICTVCGHIHEGSFPDDYECPICGQGKEVFIPYVK